MKKTRLAGLAGAALMLASPTAALAAVSSSGVTPTEFSGDTGGNVTCEQLGYEFSSARANYNDGFDASFPSGIEVTVTEGKFVAFSSTFGIGAVIVKGGNAANVYEYTPQTRGDSGLASPINASGKPAGLSNLTFCWNPEEEVGDEWCSPGYWRQPQHLDSWDATGFSPDDLFSEKVGYVPPRTVNRTTVDAPTDPTLLQVLQLPQVYGGEAFNAVGDLLSAAHPDVNFTGERVEDSCPLD
ncbi:hypothetical protein [Leptolyngbya sp. BL0902]|uniref:hypothetical protein n=1 Tax=Leptolyngbya sp. BL0902 TaxID=1115757 RepID=UPI0018E74888|nr:hypothetical protein [Leptolyngbya sp. BL0902]